MKRLKKLPALLLALTLLFSLTACGGNGADNKNNTGNNGGGNGTTDVNTVKPTTTVVGEDGQEYVTIAVDEEKEVRTLIQTATSEPVTWCLYNSANRPSLAVNFIDPLITVDEHNRFVPALAESWSANEDETVWTFNLRKGVKWVDADGNYKADVVSEDWLWGLEWVLNFWKNDSYNTTMPMTLFVGAREYYEYTQSLSEEEGWALGLDKFLDTVGIEAPDDYTLVYHCLTPVPYFESLATSVFLYPTSRGLLEALDTRGYKSVNPFTLWYNGPYIISEYIEGSTKTIVPNESYWDDTVKRFDSITWKIVESSDVAWELFQLGEINVPAFSNATLNLIASDPANPWHDYTIKSPDSGVTWGIFFNYSKHNEDGSWDEQWNKAAANENFRKAFYYGLDLYNYFATVDPVDPTSVARGTMTVYGLSKLSDGRDYTELVYDLIGFDPYTNYSHQDLSLLEQYKSAAKEELTAEGVSFPVHIDLWSSSAQEQIDKYTIVKETLEDGLGKDFVEVEIHNWISNRPSEVYWPGLMSVEIQGYGALYNDPMAFLTMLADDMDGNGEWSDMYGHITEEGAQPEIKALFREYTEKIRAAHAITGDHDARYQALAEAEAFAIEHVLMFPTHTNAGRQITNMNPYSKPANINDTQGGRYVNIETNSDFYTIDEIDLIRKAYLAT